MKLLKLVAFTALLAPLLLVGDEDHIAVGTRPTSEETVAQIEAEKTKMTEEEGSLEAAGFIFDRYPPVYYSNSYHWLTAVTILDNGEYTLKLEDGSVWKINRYDGNKALKWRENDPLTITQNHRWLSNHNYRIVNKSDNSAVEANLYLGPHQQGQYTRYIVQIDLNRKELALSDNTHWEISYLDGYMLKEWKISDAVILGSNSGWDSSCEAILINVDLNRHARAKQF